MDIFLGTFSKGRVNTRTCKSNPFNSLTEFSLPQLFQIFVLPLAGQQKYALIGTAVILNCAWSRSSTSLVRHVLKFSLTQLRYQCEALGNKSHTLCRYSSEAFTEVYWFRLNFNIIILKLVYWLGGGGGRGFFLSSPSSIYMSHPFLYGYFSFKK